MEKKVKICHLTSVHPPKDGRIFYKECVSLAEAGYDVTLIVADATDEVCKDIKIVSVPPSKGRIKRILITSNRIFNKALEINADIYHLHDPELIPVGLKLKKQNKKVIFDSHEDYCANIKEKPYLPTLCGKFISFLYRLYEKYSLGKFDAIVSVTPHLTDRLNTINSHTFQITNYKRINNINNNESRKREYASNNQVVSFVGPICSQWCIREIIDSISDDINFILAGPAKSPYFENLKTLRNWDKVKYLGILPPQKVEEIYKSSRLGFALLRYSLAVGNNIGTLGNTKLFEIMGAGIPVVCTDFILWKEIISKYKCGICINPNNTNELKEAINYILTHPKEAKEMGENGKRAIETEYNWESQEKILLQMYNDVIEGNNNSRSLS